MLVKKQDAKTKEEEKWVIRVYTDDSRYRIQLNPSDFYYEIVKFICIKAHCDEKEFEVYTPNGRKLNIPPNRRIKDVVYLSHGSILHVKLLRNPKNSAFQQRTSFLSADSKISLQTQVSPSQQKCAHPSNFMCINCSSHNQLDPFAGTGQLISEQALSEEKADVCVHGTKGKCSKCAVKEVKSVEKVRKVRSPVKDNPQIFSPCKHKPNVTCKKCVDKPSKFKSIALLQQPSSLLKQQIKSIVQTEKDKCNHGQGTKCINCLGYKKQDKQELKGKCAHGLDGKCLNCIEQRVKPTYQPFDEYLEIKKANCKHLPSSECPNCLPPVNLRLKIDKTCSRHPPYPEALCSYCQPETVTICSQKYRHVDYVQFMNSGQMHNFVKYWMSERPNQMRFGFLYGYFADDPFHHNGIRAIVEAIYEPHQYCNSQEFFIIDGEQRKSNVEMVAQNLKLEKIGMIIASTNDGECPLTETQVRVIAKIQQKQSQIHSTGYRMSNFFTVVVRKNVDPKKSIEPEVFMVSDQGQALQRASMFISNKKHAYKMKVRNYAFKNEPRASIFVRGSEADEVEIQYFLVKIGAGVGQNKKFAILKNNLFPPSSRGKIKTQQMKEYVAKTKHQPNIVRFGDFNLLIFIAEAIDPQMAASVGRAVAEEEEVGEQFWQQVGSALQQVTA